MPTVAWLAASFSLAGIGSDICFGGVLRRGYLVANAEWIREGRPTWWTWKPAEAFPRHWYINAPRGRWLFLSPPWASNDRVAITSSFRIASFLP